MNSEDLEGNMLQHFDEKQKFAAAVGCKPPFISEILSGARPLPAKKRRLWALLLQVDKKEL